MAKHWCLNGTMVNTDSYSSPLRFIGLYTAAASLVCFILMLCDLCIGLRRRKYWFPCRFFPLNSITLTLISVATKIPVDLTTAMPRAEDQLCKLTGTVFICLCMSFMAPSIGSHEEFDSYANVTALSIFVITVVVDICIQIATGVIFSFIVEHFLILFSMLLLLTRFWLSVVAINGFKNTRQNKDLIETGEESMSERLKVCYFHGYNSCQQFVSCRGPYVSGGASFSMTFSFTLIQAMLRSLVFKDFRFFLFKELRFCVGVSDYGWSTWMIMVTQILTVVVVSLAIGIRWLIYAVHVMDNGLGVTDKPSYDSYVQFLYLFSLKNLPKSLEKSFRVLVYYPLYSIDLLMKLLNKTVAVFICMVIKKCCMHEDADADADADESMKGVVLLLKSQEVVIEGWILRKGMDDMETWMKESRKDFPNHLIKLLSTIPRRQELNKMSCLSMLIFAEIAEVFAPDSASVSLTEVIGEVFEIIHFIEDITDVADYYNRLKSRYAHVIWKFRLINEVIDKEMVEKTMNEVVQPHFSSDHALKIFQQSFLRTGLRYEAHEIVHLIHWWSFTTSKELYDHIEHLFVDMLHAFLSQLPNAIFKHIHESPIGEYENRVRYCLGLICKLESLESYLQLSFPAESNLTSLSNYNTRSTVPVEGNIPTPLRLPVIVESKDNNGSEFEL